MYHTRMLSLQCVFWDVSLSYWPERKLCHMYHTCMVALWCVCWDVSLSDRLERRLNLMYHTRMLSLQCVFWDVSLRNRLERRLFHMYHTCMISLQCKCVFLDGCLSYSHEKKPCHMYHTCMVSLQWVLRGDISIRWYDYNIYHRCHIRIVSFHSVFQYVCLSYWRMGKLYQMFQHMPFRRQTYMNNILGSVEY